MEISIKKKILKIKINDRINEIKEEDLVKIFCLIQAFNIEETYKGNEYDKAYVELKYIENMPITEYLNIFKIVRTPTFYEFIKYFKKINEKFDRQNSDTKMNISDYLEKTENISQKIIIIMVFDIETKVEEIKEKSEIFLKMLKINKIDEEIFKILKQG